MFVTQKISKHSAIFNFTSLFTQCTYEHNFLSVHNFNRTFIYINSGSINSAEISTSKEKCFSIWMSISSSTSSSISINVHYLDEFRFECFVKSTNKNSFHLASLPPTPDAVRQHAFRVYYQIQYWRNNHLNPIDWGWKRTNNGLLPVTTTRAAVPDVLLQKNQL